MEPDEIWPNLSRNYHELLAKVKQNFEQQPETIERLKNIHQQIFDLTRDIENFITDIDEKNFKLSETEQQRIEDREKSNNVMKRILPVFTLSWFMEYYKNNENNENKNNKNKNNENK